MSVRVLEGDVRAMLRTLPAESVHCCVTSVPYWGLRSYGTEPQVWGGDPEHAHEWGRTTLRVSSPDTGSGLTKGGKPRLGNSFVASSGQFCPCGAWLGELGLEPTPGLYVEHIVEVFREVRRVLRPDSTLWLSIGDSYAGSGKGPSNSLQGGASCGVKIGSIHGDSGHTSGVRPPPRLKAKDLVGMPWRVAFALQQDGWYWRSTIVWAKKACMPESVRDRPTNAWEPILLLSKSRSYYYDADAVREPHEDPRVVDGRFVGSGGVSKPEYVVPEKDGMARGPVKMRDREYNPAGRNLRNVWHLGPEPLRDEHYAAYPTEIPRRAILAGCPEGGTVLDPFLGSGTTAMVADRLGRDCIGIELQPQYAEMARRRIVSDAPLFVEISA